MLALLLVTVVFGLVAADPAENPSYGYRNGHGAGPRGYGYGSPGHSYSRNGYGRQHNFYGHGYGSGHYQGADAKPLDGIDKLYKRLDTLQSELKTASEIMGNLESRMSLSKKLVDELTIINLAKITSEEFDQAEALNTLQTEVFAVSSSLTDTITLLGGLSSMNENNLNEQETIGELYAQQRRVDIEQDGEIAALATSIEDFKPKLTTTIENEYKVLDIKLSQLSFVLEKTKLTESKRMCETGQVTLDVDDRKAEYLFQSNFALVPQILHTICGFNFDMEKRAETTGYYKEPNALGLLVTADASKTGVTLELFDQSFGDSGIVTADVCFQACSIGPGAFGDDDSFKTYLNQGANV